MPELIELPTHSDPRGSLTVLDKVLPFDVKRLYWMYDLSGEPRGQHRHLACRQALICVKGRCEVLIRKNQQDTIFTIERPNQVLILEPEDWHELRNFEPGTILVLAASHQYDPADYVKEPLGA